MKKRYHTYYLLLPLLFLMAGQAQCRDKPGISGKWKLIPASSSKTLIYHYRTVSLRIRNEGPKVKIVLKWGTHLAKIDSMLLSTDGRGNEVAVKSRVWPTNIYMDVSMIPGSKKKVTARWVEKNRVLEVNSTYPVIVSQGRTEIHTTSTYALSQDGKNLTMTIRRSSRPDAPLKYVFARAGAHQAYYMRLVDNWEIDGMLPQNAFLISLQGLANTTDPNLYFLYPQGWDFGFTQPLFNFYRNQMGYSFKLLNDPEEALKTFRKYVKGYVVWDPKVRTSLDVAFTVAGLKRAVVVSPAMIPMVKKAGLSQLADFRGTFEGMNDAQIFSWAFDHYWDQCNHKFVIWMGGVAGNRMQPGIADFGVSKRSFFADLSTVPEDTAEYAMANKIFSHMKPLSMVMGWHSYAKDQERNYVTLTSSYALRVEGLNTFPNLSFTSNTSPSPGFKYKNNHNVVPGKKYIPKKKVYIACIQTDGLGLGAWNEPGRGSIPYAYEVTLNMQWMNPVFLEYFYSTATKNDLFIGAISGPGYMYPKAIPKKYLPAVIKKAYALMDSLDLNIFETMDRSEGTAEAGNTRLPKSIVEAYYKYMPDAIGFANGYSSTNTFWSRDGRPFISFEYYLAEDRPVKGAVNDLKELARLNKKRPYFLLMHVREWNSIAKVKKILDQLGPDFEVVPLDVFLKMAGQQPTFKTRFLNTDSK